jgi:hypothetical protein
MKPLLVLTICVTAAAVCHGQHTLIQYDWEQLSKSGELLSGTAVTADGRSALLIQNTNDTPLQLPLLKIKKPPISKTHYAVMGELKYERVHGDGYLEMWNYFPPLKAGLPEGQYFSRTLGISGEMGKITGTADWRPFLLPFDRTGAPGPPTRLEVNVFLPGSGTIFLGPIRLVEYPIGLSLNARQGAWWTDQTAGWAGGIAGGLLGCLASLLTWLASKGKARGFVLATAAAMIALGGALAAIGLAAVVLGQPYSVWFPLLLIAALLLGILPARLHYYRKQYQNLELRRMAAADTLVG